VAAEVAVSFMGRSGKLKSGIRYFKLSGVCVACSGESEWVVGERMCVRLRTARALRAAIVNLPNDLQS
jgi:hypothetical protein